MDFNFELDKTSSQTKTQQLLYAITESISNGELKEGDFLPSINKLSRQSGISRDTVFKTYSILKQRSILSSTPTKGYFVNSVSFKVMMLLDNYSAFKEQLYNSFRNNLPKNYTIDLLFHHYNAGVFDQLILNSLGRYSMYVVMNLNYQRTEKVINKIDPEKLLILDVGMPDNPDVSYVNQDFTLGVLDCLKEGLTKIRKYSKFNLVFPDSVSISHPRGLIPSFNYFCTHNKIESSVIKDMESFPVESGQSFLVIKDDDLVNIIKQCKNKKLRLGIDVGIISYNDSPMKEIVGSGITTISVDFKEMGGKAAYFVKNKVKIFDTLSPRLIWRGSL